MIRKRDALLAAAGLALFAFAAGRIGWGAVIRAIEEARTAMAHHSWPQSCPFNPTDSLMVNRSSLGRDQVVSEVS